MTHPNTLEEYNERFAKSHKIEGYGIDGVVIHMPCPFCAAPDWRTHTILETEAAMEEGAKCAECGRGAKAIIKRDSSSVRFEIVQTSGPNQPEWFIPKLRRLDTH